MLHIDDRGAAFKTKRFKGADAMTARYQDAEDKASKPLTRWVADNLLLIYVCCGYAACRICAELCCLSPRYSYGAEELGKVVGLLLAIVVAYTVNADRRNRLLGYLPHVAAGLGCLACFATIEIGSRPLATVSCFLLGGGASAAMIQWFEYCGLLSSRKMVIAIAAAFLINSVVGLPATQLTNLVAVGAIALLSVLLSFLLRLRCERDPQIASSLASSRRDIHGKLGTLFPPELLAWIVITGITFGIVEQSESTMIGSVTDNLGRAVPCLMVIIGYTFFNSWFDLRFLYSSILPLLVASLTLIGYEQLGTFLPGLLFSVGAVSLRKKTYLLVCVRAYQMKVSSLFGCACVMLCNVVMHFAGRNLMDIPVIRDNYLLVSSILAVFAVTVIVFLIMSESERVAIVDELPGLKAAESEDTLETLANEKGLTAREKTVLFQMAQGLTNAEIADVLFISVGAVRSHTSRIYQKLGVSTRAELDELVERLA